MSDPSATPRVETPEQKMLAALEPFGWVCGPEFWERYHRDPWVFNLANAVERLTIERTEAIAAAVREERERVTKLIPEVLGHLGEVMHRDLEYLIAAESLLAALNEETDHAL